MRREIQHLRDIAEERSLRAAESGDRDSATAWERMLAEEVERILNEG